MPVSVDKNICPHNHPCPLIRICPEGAISQFENGYPIVNDRLCVECGKCIKNCKLNAMKYVK
jgi:Fe-S-cluster-containing hydrogenase component 2